MTQTSNCNTMSHNSLPIWSFWEGPLDEVILRCFESIRAQNPSRPFIVLNKATLHKYLAPQDFPNFFGRPGSVDDFEKVQYLADWIRIVLLEKYGGVWFDASTIATAPVDSWIFTKDFTKITMFPMHANDQVHGNWAMAAPAGHPLLKAWRQELQAIFNETGPGNVPTEYIARSFLEHPGLVDLWYNPSCQASAPPLPYLWVYLALQVVLQKQPNLHNTIHLRSSIDGPMYRRYLYNIVQGETDSIRLSQKCVNDLAQYPFSSNDNLFVKLVGKDRAPFKACLEAKNFSPDSAMAEFALLPPRPIVFGQDLNDSTSFFFKIFNNHLARRDDKETRLPVRRPSQRQSLATPLVRPRMISERRRSSAISVA